MSYSFCVDGEYDRIIDDLEKCQDYSITKFIHKRLDIISTIYMYIYKYIYIYIYILQYITKSLSYYYLNVISDQIMYTDITLYVGAIKE